MQNNFIKFLSLLLAAVFFVTGCATTRPRKPDPKVEQQNQRAQMQSDLQAKDQKIQDLQAKVETYEQALQQSSASAVANNSGSTGRGSQSGSPKGSSLIRVSGVSVEDIQRALVRAGFDPGPVDGQAGKKTKAAVRKFQRRNNLKADGFVGEKTWERLK